MAFCLPFSSALTIIFSTFGVIFSILGFDRNSLRFSIKQPVVQLCVALFVWTILTISWTIAPKEDFIEGILKYRKLLFVPLIFMTLVSTEVNKGFLIKFFIAGCAVVCCGSLFSLTGIAELVLGPQNMGGGGWLLGGSKSAAWFFIGPPDRPTFGRSHIAQGAFLTFSVFYLIALTLEEHRKLNKTGRKNLWLNQSVIFLMIYVLMALGGLTGYLLFAVGIAMWMAYIVVTKNPVVKPATLIMTAVIGAAVFSHGDRLSERIDKSIESYQSYRETGADTSEGLRARFWGAGIKYGIENPIVGNGVGSYAELYSRDQNEPNHLRESRPHPHSEWIIQFVQGGVVSLILFALIFLRTLHMAARKDGAVGAGSYYRFGLVILVTLFFLDGLVNSVIWDLAEGHWFSILMATILHESCIKNKRYVGK